MQSLMSVLIVVAWITVGAMILGVAAAIVFYIYVMVKIANDDDDFKRRNKNAGKKMR